MNDYGRGSRGGSRLSGKELIKAQRVQRIKWLASLRNAASKRR